MYHMTNNKQRKKEIIYFDNSRTDGVMLIFFAQNRELTT